MMRLSGKNFRRGNDPCTERGEKDKIGTNMNISEANVRVLGDI